MLWSKTGRRLALPISDLWKLVKSLPTKLQIQMI